MTYVWRPIEHESFDDYVICNHCEKRIEGETVKNPCCVGYLCDACMEEASMPHDQE